MPRDFRYPLGPELRVAVVDGSCPGEPAEADAVALPANLISFALREWTWLPEYPIVVFTGNAHGTLTDADRDNVWQRWGIPVFEFRLSASGRVIAEECDAHEGLHLREGVDRGEFAGAEWIERRCGCGLDSPRVIQPAERPVRKTVAA